MARWHDADGAHFALLAGDIQRFQDRPYGALTAPGTPSAPPGAPIGSPAQDWIGGSGGPASFLLGTSGLGGYEWLAELVPWCSFESW